MNNTHEISEKNCNLSRVFSNLFIKINSLFFILSVFAVTHSTAQKFTANIPSTIDLTGAAGTCSTPGIGAPNVITVSVTGIGALSSTNALTEISVTLDNSCTGSSANLDGVQFRIMSPSGTCAGVYSGGLTSTATGKHVINLVSPQACVNLPNVNNGTGGDSSSSGDYGYFAAGYSGVGTNLTTKFLGENADGTWKIIFSENTGSEPCLVAASITFNNPTVKDETANGNTCGSPIPYSGTPFCAQTNGNTGEINSPGSNTGQNDITISTFNNGTCDWNGNNNNDVWIKIVASSSTVCINISGLDQPLQSIVVTNPTGDGSACPSTGEGWNVASCPNNAVYSGSNGTQKNQQHCFTAIPGNTYYLVVDGFGAAESPFYVSGSSNDVVPLPIELLYFNGIYNKEIVDLSWVTASETNNDYFTIERSANGISWNPLLKIKGAGNSKKETSYSISDDQPLSAINYYRLKQTDFNGDFSYSRIVAIKAPAAEDIVISQNSETGELLINGLHKGEASHIGVYDYAGKKILGVITNENTFHFDLSAYCNGIYFVNVNSNSATVSKKIFKNSAGK